MSRTQYDDDTVNTLLDDSICSDLSLLGIEVDDAIELELELELDVDRNSRIELILTK